MPEEEFDPEIPPLPSAAASEFEEPDEPSAVLSDRRSRLWPVMAAAVSVAALGAVTWVVYAAVMETGSSEVPYITAEAGPEKIRPQDAGGMEVPNQDIRVYDELSGAPPSPETEVLLPVPEAPITPPVAAEPQPPPAIETAEIPRVAAPAPDVEPAAGSEALTADTTPAASTPDEPETVAADAPPPEPELQTQTAAAAGAFRIQLVAVKSQDAAQAAWKKMATAHPDVLAGLTLKIVKVDRGAEGAIYRVQGGPLADRAAAEGACGKLKQKHQDCLVVAP
ncbi:MAG: SPOR domain-containing protein [Dongiaceae bacterium]